MTDQAQPAVSVVVPTREAWPKVRPFVHAIRPQLLAVGGELVIVDGTIEGCGVDRLDPSSPNGPASVRVVHCPGANIFELRAAGLVEATGPIVAMSEDHARPEPSYLQAIVRSHERHAEHAVAGAVVNGTADRLIDRVNFLLVHARNLPPRDSIPGLGWIPTPTNISYKRAAVPTRMPSPGWIEVVQNILLLHAHQVVFDDQIVVRHFQSLGWLRTFKNHFHAGRSMGGLARAAVGGRAAQARWALRSALTLPARLVRPIWHTPDRSVSRLAMLSVVPLAVAISVVDAVGLVIGVLAGPGRSPWVVD